MLAVEGQGVPWGCNVDGCIVFVGLVAVAGCIVARGTVVGGGVVGSVVCSRGSSIGSSDELLAILKGPDHKPPFTGNSHELLHRNVRASGIRHLLAVRSGFHHADLLRHHVEVEVAIFVLDRELSAELVIGDRQATLDLSHGG